jgi:putative SOS response-associated peptidase YedK
MCYYNSLAVSPGDLAQDLKVREILDYYPAPCIDGFKYGDHPVVMKINSEPKLLATSWGFLPSEVKHSNQARAIRKMYVSLNAKCEKYKTSKLYKDAFVSNHCLIPSTGFFESRRYRPKGRSAEQKFPYFISPAKTKYFFFAGIFQETLFKDTNTTQTTFAIVTRKSNSLMSQIHNNPENPNRMPLILAPQLANAWLASSEDCMADLLEYEFPAEGMKAWPVRREFKTLENPREAYHYKDLPTLDY